MKIQLNGPIEAIRGSLGKDSEFYYKVQNGQIILAHKPTQTTTMQRAKNTPDAKARQARFATLSRMADEILASPTLRAHYEDLFREHRRSANPQCSTLRGFIIHTLSTNL